MRCRCSALFSQFAIRVEPSARASRGRPDRSRPSTSRRSRSSFSVRSPNVDFQIIYAIKNFSFPIAAIGLTYALLGHRLLDVGFALNRAAVFAVLSLLVVGAFTLAEWGLGGWLASASRSTNVLVSASLALALGLAIHPIQRLTDRFVDNVFFRKRHEAEIALRAFAKEAAFHRSAPRRRVHDGDSADAHGLHVRGRVALRRRRFVRRVRRKRSRARDAAFVARARALTRDGDVAARRALLPDVRRWKARRGRLRSVENASANRSRRTNATRSPSSRTAWASRSRSSLRTERRRSPRLSASTGALVAAIEALPQRIAALARDGARRDAWTLPASERLGDATPPA